MPILRKKPFVPEVPPPDLKPDDLVFYCKATGEMFTDYEKFFERVILCNSLVWSCAMTGRSGLTFTEARDSEDRARNRLVDFPKGLHIPVLLTMSLTCRRRIVDARDEVYTYISERYFVGEEVYVAFSSGQRKKCIVERAMPPDRAPNSSVRNNSAVDSDSDSDVICIDDDELPQSVAPEYGCSIFSAKADVTSFGSSPQSYRYAVSVVNGTDILVVPAKSISRSNTSFSRERLLLFLRQNCEQDEHGIWKVKVDVFNAKNMSCITMESLFAGPPPVFEQSPHRRVKKMSVCPAPVVEMLPSAHGKPAAKHKANGNARTVCDRSASPVIDLTQDDEYVQQPSSRQSKRKESRAVKKRTRVEMNQKHAGNVNGHHQSPNMKTSPDKTIANMSPIKSVQYLPEPDDVAFIRESVFEREKSSSAIREAQAIPAFEAFIAQQKLEKRKQEEAKEQRKAQILEERARKKQERLDYEQKLKEWSKPREDMECDDLEELPVPIPVCCNIPSDAFGDAVFVLEYIHCFRKCLNFDLPKSMSLDQLGHCLVQSDIDGLFTDIVCHLLAANLRLRDEEEPWGVDLTDFSNCVEACEDDPDVKAATIAAQRPWLQYGTALNNIQLDGGTVSEILLLHLLGSGAKRLPGLAKTDLQVRGGYSSRDDPGLDFCLQEKSIIHKLETQSIFDLSPAERLKVMVVLIHQLLTFPKCRNWIEDMTEQLRDAQKELKAFQMNEMRRNRDETQFWHKKKLEKKSVDEMSKQTEAQAPVEDANEQNAPKPKTRRSKKIMNDRDFGNLPTENINWEEMGPENRELLRDWSKRKEKQLIDEIADLQYQHCNAICLIGQDRFLRRYWVFQSVAGLFVEDMSSELTNGTAASDVLCSGTKWAFFKSADEVNKLIAALNLRGFREGLLRVALSEQQERLCEWVGKCQPELLVTSSLDTLVNREDATASGPTKNCLSSLVRDTIVDLENRIYCSGLGHLQVNDRTAWREAITNNGYDSQCDHLSWFGNGKKTECVSKVKESSSVANNAANGDVCATSDVVSDAVAHVSSETWDLSRAALQVEQMVDARHLVKTLVSDGIALQRWEMALMTQPSTLSRIAVHLSVLESSIMWSRSIQNTRCRVCRLSKNPDRLLLCDKCNHGFHIYCLKPRLKAVPEGDWFCTSCEQLTVTASRKRHSNYAEESSSSSSSDESEPVTVSSRVDTETLNSTANSDEDVPFDNKKIKKWQPQIKLTRCIPDDKAQTLSSDGISQSHEAYGDKNGNSGDTAKGRSQSAKRRSGPTENTASKQREKSPGGRSGSSSATYQLKKLSVNLGVCKRKADEKVEVADTVPQKVNRLSDPSDECDMDVCWKLVTELTEKDEAWPFRRPLGRREAPGYIDVVRKPMDFSTIQSNMAEHRYSSSKEVLDDIRLIFDNCALYYGTPSSPEHLAGQKLSRHFERRLKELQLSNSATDARTSKSNSKELSRQSRKRTS